MFSLTMSAKQFFFDQQAVQDRLSKREARAMSKIGSYIRTAARSAIGRPKKSISAPGHAPASHGSEPNLRTILFAYEPSQHTMVVGPVLLRGRSKRKSFFLQSGTGKSKSKSNQSSQQGVWIVNIEINDTAPALHEYGGSGRAMVDGKPTAIRWPARPFMGPALQKESKNHKLIDAWRELL